MSIRTFIYGSCVSRDTFERLPESFELLSYVARQSAVSAFTPPTTRAIPHVHTDSSFQRRMITGDWESSLTDQLRHHADQIDLLLWDLCDERVGLRRLERVGHRPKVHAWATRSVDSIRTGVDGQLDEATRVPFASARHRVLFLQAIRRFRALLDELGLQQRTLLLAPAWATQTSDGAPVPTSFGLDPQRANRLFHDYHQAVARIAGVDVITADRVLADAHHPWGVAPFHYTEDVYRSLTSGVLGAMSLTPHKGMPVHDQAAGKVAPMRSSRVEEAEQNASVAELVRRLVADPASLWTGQKAHMADRQTAITEQFMKRNSLDDHDAVHRTLVEWASQRAPERPVTYFVVDPGGAGSHWLQEMLADAGHMNPCGEVYLPPAMLDAARSLGPADRGLLFDAVLLVHAYRPVAGMLEASLINTAHVRGWSQHKLMPEPKKLVLLTRDPLDVVLSRTFRKQNYRSRHFSDEDDETYLRRNIAFVYGFYERGRHSAPDARLRYEDLRRDAPGTIADLGRTLGIEFRGSGVGQVAGHQKSNRYSGPEVQIPEELVALAVTELADLRCELGYSTT